MLARDARGEPQRVSGASRSHGEQRPSGLDGSTVPASPLRVGFANARGAIFGGPGAKVARAKRQQAYVALLAWGACATPAGRYLI